MPRPDSSRWPLAVAASVTSVLLLLSTRYGPHRDELYFLAAGQRLDWGYPDQPPLTPLVAAAADWLAPGSLLALRLVPALIAGLVVALSADLARELGGAAPSQVLAAVATATGGGVLVVCHMLSTATLDLAAWTVVVWLIVRLLRRDRPRSWLAVGLVLGIGLQNKHLVGLLGAAMAAGVALTPGLRHHLRSPWAYAGAALAVALWLPNLAWQANNGWPQLELAADIRGEYGTAAGVAELLGFQFLLLNPLGAILAGVGLLTLLRRQEWECARPVALAYVVLLAFFLLTGGKSYYLLGLLPPLAAAGSVVLAARWSAPRLRAFSVATALTALIPLPGLLPVLPAQTLDGTVWSALGEEGLETIGWPALTAAVRDVVDDLPPGQRATAVVLTQNYGEAGAVEWLEPDLRVASGHNGFALWGPPPEEARPVVWVGHGGPPADVLVGCRQRATVRTGVDNEEDGAGVWLCTGPDESWRDVWPRVRRLRA